jgi:hypothetical protein
MAHAGRKTFARDMRNGTLQQQTSWPPTATSYQPLLKLMMELTEMWYSAAKKLMLYTIEATESVAKGVVEGQRLASGWAKDTPVAPLLEEQQDINRDFVTRTAELARRLWLLQLEQSKVATERVEEELLPLTKVQA